MKTLPTSFRKHGFSFKTLLRQGNVALLAKTAPWSSKTFYEVVLIQQHHGKPLPNGSITPPAETLPPSTSWGKKGWSPIDYPAALTKFNYLTQRQNAHSQNQRNPN